MSTNDIGGRLQELLSRALSSQPLPGEPHPVDDQDLLRAWSDGTISPSALEATLAHVAQCPECRQVLDDLVAAEIFHPAAAASSGAAALAGAGEEHPSNAPAGPAGDAVVERAASSESASPKSISWVGWAIAAAVLVIGGIVLTPLLLAPDKAATLARLESEADTSPEKVLEQSAALLAEDLPPELQARARKLVEVTSFHLADAAMKERRFERVSQLAAEAARLEAISGRLTDLQLRAELGGLDPSLLAYNDRLTRRFTLTGERLEKNLVIPPPPIEPVEQKPIESLQAALQQYPRNFELRLSMGWRCLRVRRPSKSEQIFAELVQENPDHFEARLGLGAARFELGKRTEALGDFQAAARMQPGNEVVLLNEAITLESLQRASEAKPLWEELLERTRDAALRESIRERLEGP